MEIRLEEVTKRFDGGPAAVDGVTMTIPSGKTLCLLGTSGSGKTTILKMINRLAEPSSGRILVGGEDVAGVDPIRLRRSIGYVIQGGGLFPHWTVEDNVGLMGRLLGWDRDRTAGRVRELLSTVRLDPDRFGGRYPAELSGGQQQRVGVARALLSDPPVVLMDEPFGALDAITRHELQAEFLDLEARLARTIVFVTHDLAEAARLADLIAFMDGGRLQQVGPPADLWDRPAGPLVERFVSVQAAGLARPASAP